MTVPLIFVWPYGLIFWAALIWITVPEMRFLRAAKTSGALRSEQDAGTGNLVIRGTNVVLPAAVASAVLISAATFPHRKFFFFAGVALLIAGGVLRRHCFRVLGKHFTYAVQVSADQPVVDSGAYRWVRHPSYLAGMLMYAGWGFALTNWVSLALLLVASAWFYSRRMAVEERALMATIGDAYREYMGRTKRLVPFLY
ncbi:MAG: methyltransferase family protein [Gemmatimonadaceae bacterium]